MSNFKKIVSMAIAFVMVLGLMAPAFALSSDVVGTEYEDAAALLGALNIMVGDAESGNFRPEDTIKRSEFAKVAVAALGLESAADAANTTTAFPDVVANHWATGYINVAVGQGIMKGDAEGTFRPDANISYAEALTVLVRALGYKDSFLTGAWPANFIAKAAELDITDGVSVASANAATRGNVAKMVVNTLDANVIQQSSFGDENNWEETDDTLISTKLNIDKLEKLVVTATPKVQSTIEKSQITMGGNTYDVAEGAIADIDALLGLSLNIYVNADDEIIFAENSEENFKVIYDVVDEEETINNSEITLVNADNDYEWATGAKIYLDNEDVTNGAGLDALVDTDDVVYGKFVLNSNGNIILADLQEFDSEGAVIVTSVDTDKSRITYNIDDADDEDLLKLDDFDSYAIYDVNGNAMSIEDIEKDDIMYFNTETATGDLEEAASGDEVAYVVIVRNGFEGNLNSYDSDEVEINDESYDWSNQATVSIDNDDNYELVSSAAGIADLDDISDEEANVVALRDLEGNVRHVRTDVEGSSDDFYGIITGVETYYGDYTVKLLNTEEDEVEYSLDIDEFAGYDAESDIAENDIVKYTLNTDGEIDTIEFIGTFNGTASTTTTNATANAAVVLGEFDDDFEAETVKFESDSFIVSDDVVVFDYSAAADGSFDPADAEVLDYANLVDKDGAGAEAFVLFGNNEVVELIVFTAGFEGTDDEQAGYIVDRRTKDGKPVVDLAIPGVDGTTRYTVDDNAGLASDEALVIFKTTTDGKIDLVDDVAGNTADYNTVTGYVYEIDGKYVTLADVDGNVLGTFKVGSNAAFYMEDDKKSFSDLDEGVSLVTVAVKDKMIEVVKIFDIENNTANSDSEAVAFFAAYNDNYDLSGAAMLTDLDAFHFDTVDNDKYDVQ